MIVEVDSEDFFSDKGGCIGGMARLSIEAGHCMDADIGGSDGWQVTSCTLLNITIGGLTLTADQLATAFGAKFVVSFEERVAEEYYERGMAA